MARQVRKSALETRTSRLKLPVAKKPEFVRIGHGISLGYRRNQVTGTWVLRIANGKGGSTTEAIGHADDHDDADGLNFLDFFQAQEKARKLAQSQSSRLKPLTVREAADSYLVVLAGRNRNTAHDTKLRLEKHFLPQFGDFRVNELTKTKLESWLASLIPEKGDPERLRRSRDTANRLLTMVKALLNHALKDESNGLMSDHQWRLVRGFPNVSRSRPIRYTDEQVKAVIDNCKDDAVVAMFKAAYLTGVRYGELKDALVASVDLEAKTWTVSGKTGQRAVILQSSAVSFFRGIIGDRPPNVHLFVRSDGTPWKRSDQNRPVKKALKAAGLSDEGSLYALRHTYISVAIEGQVPLTTIAKNCGTSVRMIEKTYAKLLKEKERDFIEIGTPSLR